MLSAAVMGEGLGGFITGLKRFLHFAPAVLLFTVVCTAPLVGWMEANDWTGQGSVLSFIAAEAIALVLVAGFALIYNAQPKWQAAGFIFADGRKMDLWAIPLTVIAFQVIGMIGMIPGSLLLSLLQLPR